MQALIDEILHCIIHKPMSRHAADPGKSRTRNADSKMAAKTFGVSARVPGMRSAFVDHFKMRGLQYPG